jgi:homoserine kinase type II
MVGPEFIIAPLAKTEFLEDSMNWDELGEIWPMPGAWSVRPIIQGINNLTQIIDTPSGRYILRTYDADRPLERIRYELSLLRNLQQKNLPFHIPAPIPTVTGETFAVLPGGMVTLSPWLSGSAPEGANLEQAVSAGQALAELVKVLADTEIVLTTEVAPFSPSGDFEAWAGSTVDPANLILELPLAQEEQEQILRLLEDTQATTPSLYQTLPQQIIHRAYDQSNILMEGNLVTGVLDFEFCGPDLRILDLAYALSQWPAGWWNTGKEWNIIDAFVQGYLKGQMLTLEELEALPAIFRLRFTASLFFRLGRYVRGLETQESLLQRIRGTLISKNWLDLHEEKLLSYAYTWYHKA